MSRIKGDKIALVGLVMYLFSTVYLLQMSPQSLLLVPSRASANKESQLDMQMHQLLKLQRKTLPCFRLGPIMLDFTRASEF